MSEREKLIRAVSLREQLIRDFADMFHQLDTTQQASALVLLGALQGALEPTRTEYVDKLVELFDPPDLLIEDDDSPYFEGWKKGIIYGLNYVGVTNDDHLVEAGLTRQDASEVGYCRRGLSPSGIAKIAKHWGYQPTDIDPGYKESEPTMSDDKQGITPGPWQVGGN